ncbi:glycosyl hydrolase family 28-related protein [Pedosphaera parvula]|uniref:Parallel beta-helix repeat protein n=1 Tax=Pedosphaera parvula (strain Ellin514) TaxID=320771 RepID=B9XHM6_PEDPL|nr:glycosyl hydrolase family 28-related protein [Pedosphaera parvula]EEF60604.1 parallel beta-helix repeat protein [Pedosphaera parvula Ellin514]
MKALFRFAVFLFAAICSISVRAGVGADTPWTTYEAEEMKTTGTVLGPKYAPFLVETESSQQKCVKLAAPGEYVEFTAQSAANAIVVRYSLPDSETGGGISSSLGLYKNGKLVKLIPVTSRYSWLYGNYPFSNQPKGGKPRNFYNELRLKDQSIVKGDVIRLQKTEDNAAYCIIDLVDLEKIAPPLSAPTKSLSIMDFGAAGTGESDDTEALRKCIAAAKKQAKTVWVPAGVYKLTGDIVPSSDMTIQGAGMWHTTFVGDAELYSQAEKRIRFKLTGSNIRLADFAIEGKLNYRDDNEANDGIVGANCEKATISRVWVEHTKVGAWIYNGAKLTIEECRFRNLLADGVNFCVGTRESVVQNCTARGTGDDCFAIWPAPSDQGFAENNVPGLNIFRRCTGQLTFLANGAAIYGGTDNKVEDCLFTDISSGCGILISTTFPTSDEARKIDNNFSGTTVVRNCDLIRCGGYDHGWTWRGSFQLCMDRRSISGVQINNINIRDSFSDGLTIVAPGGKKGQGTLSNVRLENVNIPNCGIGSDSRRGLWIREDAAGSLVLVNSQIADIQNSSSKFEILRQ